MTELTHRELWDICRKLPEDYEPYGEDDRQEPKFGPDCSWGCRWFHKLEGDRGMDWGICGNKKSHRCGLLTFEHQGCRAFESHEWVHDKGFHLEDKQGNRIAHVAIQDAEHDRVTLYNTDGAVVVEEMVPIEDKEDTSCRAGKARAEQLLQEHSDQIWT